MATEGDYTFRVTFYDESLTTYKYIREYDITISEAGEEDGPVGPGGLWEQIMDWIGITGLDTETGHIAVTLIGMVVVFVIFFASALLRVAAPILVLLIALVTGWVDPWLYILLALGAGVFVFSIFKKRASGGAGEA